MQNKMNSGMNSNPYYVEAIPVADNATPYAYTPNIVASAPMATSLGTNFSQYDEVAAKEYLSSCKWPVGLQHTFLRNLSKIPIRYFVCDDSGSMSTSDGHRLVHNNGNSKFVSCTRWNELTAALQFHASLAKAAKAPTQFRLLNGAPPIMIGDGTDYDNSKFQSFLSILQSSPSGGTPLCRHIREIIQEITAIAPQLRAQGQRACVVIATDGESSDGNVADALRPLKDLPAWVVIRLCTDEDRIVDYWNNIDNDLELDMDVLDDLEGEAKEIAAVNPWLNYAEPMHRLREFGIPIKEIDLLDESTLSPDQVRFFCSLLFGGDRDNYPHPEEDWHGFCEMINDQSRRVGQAWNPIAKRNKDWIEVHRIKRVGGTWVSSCAIM